MLTNFCDVLNFVFDTWKASEKGVFLRVVLSDTSGYEVSFIVPFNCNRDLFAAERTNVDAFNC